MTSELRISRRALVLVLFGLSVTVIYATLLGRDRLRSTTASPAVRLLQLRVLSVLDRAVSVAPWTGSDQASLQALEEPGASRADLRNAARLFLIRGRLDEGIERCRVSLQNRPGDPGLLFVLSRLLLASGRPSEAQALAAQALRQDPGLWPAGLVLASCAASEGRLAEALERARGLLSLDREPDAARLAAAYADSAVYSLNLGRAAEALESATRALQWLGQTGPDPRASLERAYALFVRASAYNALQGPAEALVDLHESLDLARQTGARALEAHVLFTQALALRSQARESDALELERQVAQLINDQADDERLQRLLALPDSVSRSGPS